METGILTFHRVYNYGAVLQAYALQKVLEDMGVENEIIDFSLEKQRDVTSLYSTHNGIKKFVKTLSFLPFHAKRKRRIDRFDDFINEDMRLSEKRYCCEEELEETNSLYNAFLVGSDQVWNVTKKAEASDGYFLNFAADEKRKISYASSIGIASYEELADRKKLLERFDKISCREQGGAQILEKLTGHEVPVVLDPTLLVDAKHLINLAESEFHSPYILYYSLDGYDKRNNNLKTLKMFSEKFELPILFVTPEWPRHKLGSEIMDAGPKEFLGLIKNASLVCTNSFHGTALSVKMNKPFFVLEQENIKDERKRSILRQLGLLNRIISSNSDAAKVQDYFIDYSPVNKKLMELQKLSSAYLEEAVIGK